MSNSILIGKAIYAQLTADTKVVGYVGTKVFPLVAENDTTFPFIAYTREGIDGSYGYTKDGNVGDKVQFKVDVVSDSYNQSCEIANDVRKCLEKSYYAYTENNVVVVKMQDCILTSMGEAYDSETFIQTLRFTCLCV